MQAWQKEYISLYIAIYVYMYVDKINYDGTFHSLLAHGMYVHSKIVV